MQQARGAKHAAHPNDVGIPEAGRLMAVGVEYAPAGAVPINWNHEFRSIARIAGDVPGAKEADILDEADRLIEEALATDAMEPDGRASRLVAAGREQHLAVRSRKRGRAIGILDIEPDPADAARVERCPECVRQRLQASLWRGVFDRNPQGLLAEGLVDRRVASTSSKAVALHRT